MPALPPAFRDGTAAWTYRATAPWDPDALVRRARQLCAAVLPPASGFKAVAPQEYSYWLAANLPLENDVRWAVVVGEGCCGGGATAAAGAGVRGGFGPDS